MRSRLVIGTGLIAIAIALAASGALGIVAAMLAFLVAIVGPGVVITRMLSGDERLGLAPAAVLATGLGIAAAIVGALLLDLTPVSILWLGPILVALSVGSLAWLEWRDRARRPRTRLLARLLAGLHNRNGIDYDQALLLLVAAALVTGSIVIARAGADGLPPEGAQLWMIPGAGDARIGVRNTGPRSQSWQLVETEGGRVLLELPLTLGPGEDWQSTLDLPARHGEVSVALLVPDSQTMVRQVTLAATGS